MSAGTAWLPVKPDMRGFGSDLDRGVQTAGASAGGKFSDGFKSKLKVGAAIGAAFATAAVGNFLKGAITEASNLGESINAVNVTFGKSAEGILALGRNAADSLGLSRSQFNGLAVQFSAFAGTIAGKGGDVVGVMKDLTTRGADFASVMNIEVNDAMALFQSGLAGETEPLRKFGIDLSAAAVEAHAYKTGIAEAGAELTENQKVQSRYSLLMKQTSKTQGDFANTSDSLANSQRRLKANFADLQAEAGSKLLPMLEKLSGWALNDGLPALENFGSFIKDHKSELIALGFVVGGLTLLTAAHGVALNVAAAGGMAKYLASTRLISGSLKVWAAAQWLLNAAMTANPIGLVIGLLVAIGAALVIAYKKSDTFRAVVDKAWKVVGDGARWLWEKAIKPVVGFILKGLASLMDMWAGMLRALGKVPGFGWATRAAEKMENASRKVRALGEDVDRLDGKKAKITVDVYVPPLTAGERNTLNAIKQGNFIGGSGPNAPKQDPIQFKAAGGPVRGMRPYIVGEEGPELFVPRVNGSIIPNHRLGSSGQMLSGAQFGGAGSGGIAEGAIQITMPATATPQQSADAAGGRVLSALTALGV